MHVFFFWGGGGLQIYKQTAMQALAKTQIHKIMVQKKYKKMLHQHPQTLGFGLRYVLFHLQVSAGSDPSYCVCAIVTDTQE